jgi:hypothetical protein
VNALIDGDLIAYRCAASCEKQGVVVADFSHAQSRANEMLVSILDATKASSHALYLTGSNNFRFKVSPLYKSNRLDMKRPDYLEPLREWLIVEHGAIMSEGCEADDLMAIAQTKNNGESIICTLDKDLRQVPGWHYSWEISGTGSTGKQWVRPASLTQVSPEEGLFNFYWQVMMGDISDFIPGYDGKMRAKVPKFMEPMYEEMQMLTTEDDLFEYVYNHYNLDHDQLLANATCLWMQRYEDEDWRLKGKALLERVTTEEHGPKAASTPSSLPPSEQEPDDGNPNMTR